MNNYQHIGSASYPQVRLFLILFLIFLFPSCSAIQDLAKMQKPALAVNNVRVTNLSLKNIELTFDVEVDNPNPVAVKLTSYDYGLEINQTPFINGTQNSGLEVGAGKKSVISIPVSFGYNELYSTFAGLKNKDETSYSFSSEIGFEVPVLGITKLPIKKSGTFPVVKIPSLDLGEINIENISLSKADLSVELRINNPNAFGMILDNLNYNLNINGMSPLSGQTAARVEVEEKSSGILKIPLSINFVDAGLSAYRILQGNKNIDYTISGSTSVGATLPFFDVSTFNFDKSGTVDILR